MKYIHTLLVLITFVANSAIANTSVQDAQQFLSQQVQLEEKMRPQMVSPIDRNNRVVLTDDNISFIDQMKNKKSEMFQQSEEATPDAYYFVSFSIPTEGLKRMVAESDQFYIAATIRGMVGNDMNTTINAFRELIKDSNKGGIQIDPRPFATYGITSVPVLVVTCSDNRFDRISGNIRIREALERIAASGECSEKASQLLQGARK